MGQVAGKMAGFAEGGRLLAIPKRMNGLVSGLAVSDGATNAMDRRGFLKISSAGTVIIGIGSSSVSLLTCIDAAAQNIVSMPAHYGVNDPSTLAGVKPVLFDTFGTVVD